MDNKNTMIKAFRKMPYHWHEKFSYSVSFNCFSTDQQSYSLHGKDWNVRPKILKKCFKPKLSVTGISKWVGDHGFLEKNPFCEYFLDLQNNYFNIFLNKYFQSCS